MLNASVNTYDILCDVRRALLSFQLNSSSASAMTWSSLASKLLSDNAVDVEEKYQVLCL
jgi:hypothetical protein